MYEANIKFYQIIFSYYSTVYDTTRERRQGKNVRQVFARITQKAQCICICVQSVQLWNSLNNTTNLIRWASIADNFEHRK